MAEAEVVRLSEVSKAFNGFQAVSHLTLTVPTGQIFGLIGPSGSGKTTTIRLLMGVFAPDEGEIRVMDSDPRRFSTRQREQIGYSPQGFFLYPTLTAKENVHFVAGLFGIGWLARRRKTRKVLEALELWDARNRLTRNLSGGMRRRLVLACALVHDPTLLFVDEPTAGLDPLLRAKIWTFLGDLRSQGRTVFVTTQMIEEIRHCDTVAIMNQGAVVAVGSPLALRRQAMGGDVVDVDTEDVTPDSLRRLRSVAGVREVHWTDDGALRVVVEEAGRATPLITQTLSASGVGVTAVREVVPGFDEVFRRIVERGD